MPLLCVRCQQTHKHCSDSCRHIACAGTPKPTVQQPVDGATEDPMRNTGQSGGRVVRGIYGRMPQPADADPLPLTAQSANAHVDSQPAHIIVTAHIDQLPPGSGGTLLFPGSHTLLHARNPTFSQLMAATRFQEYEDKDWSGFPYRRCVWATDTLQTDYQAVREYVRANIDPIEFCGGEGDVLLWHARCFHAASRNYSGCGSEGGGSGSQPCIRQAVFYDSHRADMLGQSSDLATSHRSDGSMWAEWSEQVRAAAATGAKL
eukprot:COSAG05_NODE_2414_length_3093_cov_4.084900_2_plen_261_part_00